MPSIGSPLVSKKVDREVGELVIRESVFILSSGVGLLSKQRYRGCSHSGMRAYGWGDWKRRFWNLWCFPVHLMTTTHGPSSGTVPHSLSQIIGLLLIGNFTSTVGDNERN